MKKVYSKKLGAEAYALAPEQLEVFRQAGYTVPKPEEVIADAGAAILTPPEGAKAYVVMNLKSGEFSVRVRGCTVKGGAVSALVSEIVRAGMVKTLAERADPDRPKTDNTASNAPTGLSGLIAAAIKRAASGSTAASSAEGATGLKVVK